MNEEAFGIVERSDALTKNAWPKIQPQRIRVSSVASGKDIEDLRGWLEQTLGCTPELATTSREADSLICGYEDPSKLGIDRWLAMLSARRIAVGPFVVIDVGTAATIDFVTDTGVHEGGHIVPGLRLMTGALFRGTAEVRVGWSPNEPVLAAPGKTTVEAVRSGVVLMLGDFARGCVARFGVRCGGQPHIYICGGDAELIAPLIPGPTLVRPHLVLEGLDVALP